MIQGVVVRIGFYIKMLVNSVISHGTKKGNYTWFCLMCHVFNHYSRQSTIPCSDMQIDFKKTKTTTFNVYPSPEEYTVLKLCCKILEQENRLY